MLGNRHHHHQQTSANNPFQLHHPQHDGWRDVLRHVSRTRHKSDTKPRFLPAAVSREGAYASFLFIVRLFFFQFKQVEEYMAYRKLPRGTRQKISEYFEHRYQVDIRAVIFFAAP